MTRNRRAWMAPAPLIGAASAALLLAACASTPSEVKNAAPSIKDALRKQPSVDKKIALTRSEPTAPDPDKAMENYKQLLELNPDEETRAEALRRSADLGVQTDDLKGGGEGSAATLGKSIKIYEQLLKDRPGDRNNDRVLYQLARAQQNGGDTDASIATLLRMNKEFPDSNLAGDAHFRRAELLFLKQRYAEAEVEYGMVMTFKDRTPFFEPSQYKYGWALYKQNKYDEAISSFFNILERELPAGEVTNTDAAMKGVKKGKSDLVRDSLRVVSLSLATQGGGPAANDYFQKHGDPRFFPLIYDALGKLLIERERYTDAAETFAAFPVRYAKHPLAPEFQTQVIGAYKDGGFRDLVIREKERYATVYDPRADYWSGKPATPEVMTELRKHMEDLGRHYHALAQANKADRAKAQPQFLVAAKWYQRFTEVFPDDPKSPEIGFLFGDALLDGGRTREAAEQYAHVAYDLKPHPRTADAALASFQTFEKYAKEVPAAEQPAALRLAIDSGIRLADKFQFHPEKLKVLTQVAKDLYDLKALDEAIKVAQRILANEPAPSDDFKRLAYSVIGDSQFAQQRYPEAEQAFAEELKLTPPNTPQSKEVGEQLAAAIYKQGEIARDAKDLRRAVGHFLRLGEVVPTASIRPNAEYDAAAGLIQMEDWPTASKVLEGFRTTFPTNALIADVDKKLAVSYQKDNKPAQAAGAYMRVAQRQGETPAVRMEAAWLAATLFDESKLYPQAGPAYELYVNNFPKPVDRAMQARSRLVDFARDGKNSERELFWLNEIVKADAGAGAERTDATKAMAAKSSLQLGRFASAQARAIRLTLPIEKSLPAKQQAVENAIQTLTRAGSFGFADVTTAATYELGLVHQDLAKSLMDSERPKLSGLELEQYNVLIEEQSFPFEEKAIQAHETNLRRIPNGIYDQWVAQSAKALAQIAPGKYGKREKSEETYESLK